MTREDIDRIASEYFDDKESEHEMDEVFDLAKKALEERREDILDKIRPSETGGQVMSFPNTFDEYAEQYQIIDTEEVYTNKVALDVKAGDTVIVWGTWGRKRISTVQKVTPTGKIRVDNNLYSATGIRHINTFEVEYLEIATPEKIKAIRDRYTILKAITMCREIDIADLTVEQAEKIIAILRKEDEEKHNETLI